MKWQRTLLIVFLCLCIIFKLQLAAYPAVNEIIQITLERTGGFAGITTTKIVNTANLPIDKANQLRQLIHNADFFNLPTNINSKPPHPDRFKYKIIVEKNGQRHTVVVNEEAVTRELQPLIKWVRDLEY
ncbi:protealysin inhibitor emfourin [Nostoc sp. LEGE 12447]|uniref:protealysin inhibitor emfourin n=1 Tax=Nostoc sp. LEGE 12447 TaxID=1828640 RepID=UPI001D13E525|nr:protealysin inhibitor emfourin [Nostoc sp. LEGE 12447]